MIAGWRGLSALCAGAAALAALGGCRGGGSAMKDLAHARPVDTVGEFKLDAAALARHIRYETGLPDDQVDRMARARLAEDLLAEALLARAAEREQLQLPAQVVAEEFARLQGVIAAAAPPAALQEDARRRLLARLYERRVLVRQVVVPQQDVDEEARRQEQAAGEEQIVFRQLRADSLQAAEKAYRDIIGGEPFERLAGDTSAAPDKGRALSRTLSELPPAAADALRGLGEGAVTRPVNLDGAYYLFQLVARTSGGGADREHSQDDIRRQLESRALDEIRRRALVDLARTEGVRAPVSDRPEEDATR